MDRETQSAARLTDELRRWLRSRPESPDAKGAAMAYEAAALIGKYAESQQQAADLIDAWADGMKRQIAAFGVGTEHP